MDDYEGPKPATDVKGYSPKDIENRIIKEFLDILILIDLKKQGTVSGYEVIEFINGMFGGLLSPGTVYSMLYLIERKGLIKGVSDGRKTIYKLTELGEASVESTIANFHQEMILFTKKFLTLLHDSNNNNIK